MPALDMDPETTIQINLLNQGSNPSTRKESQLQQLHINIPTPCTVRELVSAQFDLWAIPQRRFLRRLAAYATEPREHEKLIHLSRADGSDDLVQYAYRERRTVLMTLRGFPSARPPLSALIRIILRIRPRVFSTASSPHQFSTSVSSTLESGTTQHIVQKARYQLCVARVRYVTPLRFQGEGLCSGFLSRCRKGDIIPVALERAQPLRFYPSAERPALLIATGTGIAPMRSYLLHHHYDKSERVEGGLKEIVHTKLVFGCRSHHGDYLYQDQLEQCAVKIATAFSRDENDLKR